MLVHYTLTLSRVRGRILLQSAGDTASSTKLHRIDVHIHLCACQDRHDILCHPAEIKKFLVLT